jgi:hypothetical protein
MPSPSPEPDFASQAGRRFKYIRRMNGFAGDKKRTPPLSFLTANSTKARLEIFCDPLRSLRFYLHHRGPESNEKPRFIEPLRISGIEVIH